MMLLLRSRLVPSGVLIVDVADIGLVLGPVGECCGDVDASSASALCSNLARSKVSTMP